VRATILQLEPVVPVGLLGIGKLSRNDDSFGAILLGAILPEKILLEGVLLDFSPAGLSCLLNGFQPAL
jgi:hypothetical protein